eukprot:979786-Pyramimonas_sp.AAC.1
MCVVDWLLAVHDSGECSASAVDSGTVQPTAGEFCRQNGGYTIADAELRRPMFVWHKAKGGYRYSTSTACTMWTMRGGCRMVHIT